jgi:hypothetical protein
MVLGRSQMYLNRLQVTPISEPLYKIGEKDPTAVRGLDD